MRDTGFGNHSDSVVRDEDRIKSLISSLDDYKSTIPLSFIGKKTGKTRGEIWKMSTDDFVEMLKIEKKKKGASANSDTVPVPSVMAIFSCVLSLPPLLWNGIDNNTHRFIYFISCYFFCTLILNFFVPKTLGILEGLRAIPLDISDDKEEDGDSSDSDNENNKKPIKWGGFKWGKT